jgi:hypothetical protein
MKFLNRDINSDGGNDFMMLIKHQCQKGPSGILEGQAGVKDVPSVRQKHDS